MLNSPSIPLLGREGRVETTLYPPLLFRKRRGRGMSSMIFTQALQVVDRVWQLIVLHSPNENYLV